MDAIRDRRISRGISGKQMAERLSVAPQRWSDYERGKRRCPAVLWEKACGELGLSAQHVVPFSKSDYRRYAPRQSWGVQVDPGQSWATVGPSYRHIYRRIAPKRMPGLAFRSLVHCDSALEPLGWTQLCEAGFEPVVVSPVRMHFGHYALLDHRGRALGMASKAAFLLNQGDFTVIVWPQMWMYTPAGRICPDALILVIGPGIRRWYLLEIDGGAHTNPKWDKERDEQLELTVLRFGTSDIQGLGFAQKLLSQLGLPPPD